VLAHDLGHHLRADEVVDDRGAGLLLEHLHRDEGGGERTRDAVAALVDQEHTIGVAVERETDIGAGLDDAGDEVELVLGLDRISRVVGERAVELGEQHLEVERQPGERQGNDEPPHAVGGVGHDLERPQRRNIDERVQVLDERVDQRLGRQLAAACCMLDAVRRDGGASSRIARSPTLRSASRPRGTS
jgi:hypothetical protein